jgi:hypothetical protein
LQLLLAEVLAQHLQQQQGLLLLLRENVLSALAALCAWLVASLQHLLQQPCHLPAVLLPLLLYALVLQAALCRCRFATRPPSSSGPAGHACPTQQQPHCLAAAAASHLAATAAVTAVYHACAAAASSSAGHSCRNAA